MRTDRLRRLHYFWKRQCRSQTKKGAVTSGSQRTTELTYMDHNQPQPQHPHYSRFAPDNEPALVALDLLTTFGEDTTLDLIRQKALYEGGYSAWLDAVGFIVLLATDRDARTEGQP